MAKHGLDEDEFDPDEPGQLDAMRAMVEYLIPQARQVSSIAALHLTLARTELDTVLAIRDGVAASIARQ